MCSLNSLSAVECTLVLSDLVVLAYEKGAAAYRQGRMQVNNRNIGLSKWVEERLR